VGLDGVGYFGEGGGADACCCGGRGYGYSEPESVWDEQWTGGTGTDGAGTTGVEGDFVSASSADESYQPFQSTRNEYLAQSPQSPEIRDPG